VGTPSKSSSPNICHICGRRGNVSLYEFGLGLMGEDESPLGAAARYTVLNILLNAIFVPLLGICGFAWGGRNREGLVYRLKLQVCDKCEREDSRKGWFTLLGDIRLTEQDCSHHPYWDEIRAKGFTTFIPPHELQQFNK